jgi:DNA helicase-2/ATP-dependent DNA helicase PcrA
MKTVTQSDHIEPPFSDDFELRPDAYEALRSALRETSIDTRDALAKFVPQGDEHQQRVIDATESTVRLVAPAGSGKTQTVIHRVLSRIRDGLKASRILVLTFDRAAASSLQTKLDEELGRLQAEVHGLTISTLNAYGLAILREHFPSEAKPIVPDWRARRLVRECRAKLNEVSAERAALLPSNLADRLYLDVFSVFKNQLFDPRALNAQALADFIVERPTEMPFFEHEVSPLAAKKIVQAVLWLYQRYDSRLSEEGVIDFDDQKLRAFRSLTEQPGLLTALQSRYGEVIVDEFQDINRLDFEFIKAIASKATLVVTGDDDQAIYGFRGCSPDYIIDLEQHLGRTVTAHELKVNYRCPPNLVEHADRLIQHNTRRIPKAPTAHRTTPSQVKVVSSLGAGLEAKWIVELIKRIKHENATLDWSDFAVLYRTNAQSLAPQVEFILGDVPYDVRSEDNILANEELEKLLGAFRLKFAVAGRSAPRAADAVLTTQAYFRYLKADDLARATALFEAGTTSFLELISSARFATAVPRAAKANFRAGVEQFIAAPTLTTSLDVLSQKFAGLRGMIGSLEDVLAEKVPLGEIYEIAMNFRGDADEFVGTIARALERARAIGAGRNEQGVALRTYFRSKGLQWHTVILIGCNDGVIPHQRSLGDRRKLEEERRLFYVAMTRAEANLVVSYVKNVAKGAVAPSRFLREAGLL